MRSIPHIPGPHILMTLMLGGRHKMSTNNLTRSFHCPIMSSLSNTGHLNFSSSIEIEISGARAEDNKVTSHFEIESDFNLSGHWGSRPAPWFCSSLDDNGRCLPGDWITETQWGISLQYTEPARAATYTNNIGVIETGSSVGYHQYEPFINFHCVVIDCKLHLFSLLPAIVTGLEGSPVGPSTRLLSI